MHVTGASGFLGRYVVRSLKRLGQIQGTDIDDMDVTDAPAVLARLQVHPPQVLVHLAALKGNLPSRQRPLEFFKVNTLGTLNLLEACRQLGIKRFVFMSSLTVLGPTDHPVDETHPIRPLHPYGASKAAAEALVHAYSNSYELEALILRPNFIVGPIPAPHHYVDNLIYDFIDDIEREGKIELAGDGHYQREWVHPADVAEAVALAVSTRAQRCETFILSGNRLTMWDLAERIIRRIGKGRVTSDPGVAGFTLISSSEKARSGLGWKPRVDIDMIIDEIWNEYRSRVSQ
ncbi:MAG: NAD-dependent epimerase/dehydratase family protein [Candidatus Methylomirabilales bacterium]